MGMLVIRMTLITIVALLVYDVIAVIPEGHYLWEKVENDRNGLLMESLGKSWNSPSRMDCIRKCAELFDTCSSVQFDNVSKNCTAGTWIRKSDVVSPPTTSVFYRKYHICGIVPGFSYIERYNERVCIHVSYELMTRDLAQENCKQMGGVLYMPKTIGKLTILRSVVSLFLKTDRAFLGLRQAINTTVFYWDDGEQFLPGALWDYAWPSGHPKNMTTLPCVVFRRVVKTILDFGCDSAFHFCEKLLD